MAPVTGRLQTLGAAREAHDADDRRATRTLAGRRVLIIEQDADLRRLFAITLRRAGCDVASFASGADAELALAFQRFDAAVIDLSPADGNGQRLVTTVRLRAPEIRIVGVCARRWRSPALPGAAGHPDATLHKPFAIVDLVAALGALLTAEPALA